ncbi:MAG: serine/threonine-protein kinase [Pseudomonadota bacterium]
MALFTRSLDVDPEERHEWLIDQCHGNRGMLAAVLRLVAADQKEDSLLDQAVLAAGQARAGDRAGPFELVEEIGSGGAGRVFRARRADGVFEQDVAVKLFEARRLSGPLLDRFHAERQILATLEHPGIARLIDGGATAEGIPYVAMELIRGRTITAYCAENRLDVPERLALVQKVCAALEAAHSRGIVHRDIKPGNVLVNDSGDVKVIDFGIAKVLDPVAVGLPEAETQTRFQALTPEYASPEQVRGEATGMTTDVYSLGVLLYELVTGVRPYQISTLTPAEVERTVCHTIPDDPSERVRRRRSAPPGGLAEAGILKRILRGDVDRIVMTALRKEPEERYASAAALARDIERYLSGEPVAARGASRIYRARKFIQRHRAVSAAVVCVIGILAAALAVVTDQARQAREAAERAQASQTFLLDMITQADPFENTDTPTVAAAVEQAIPKIDAQFADQPAVAAELRYAVGFAMSGLGKYELAQQQLTLAQSYFAQHGPVMSEALALAALARLSWEFGESENARAQFEEGLALLASDDSPESLRTRVEILGDLSGLMPDLEAYREGVALARQALAMADAGVELAPLNRAITYNNLAVNHDGLEEYEAAIAAYEKSISFHREANPEHPDLAVALANLALTYELVGKMPQAVARLREAYRMLAGILGDAHPTTVLNRYNLGSMLLNAGETQEAAQHLSAVAASGAEAYGEAHLYTGRFHFRAAMAWEQLGKLDQARTLARRAREIYSQNEDVSEDWLATLADLETRLGP